MASDQGMEFVPGADNRSQPIMLATGHFWCQPVRLSVQADGGQLDDLEPIGSELEADQQAALTWCDSEN